MKKKHLEDNKKLMMYSMRSSMANHELLPSHANLHMQ